MEKGENIAKLGNILGTWKEHSANTLGNWETWKKNSTPTRKQKRKKSKAPWVHAWAFPLVAWKQDVLLFIDNIFHFVQAGAEVSTLLGRMASINQLWAQRRVLYKSAEPFISLPKRLGHHFSPGLTSLAKNTLPIQCWDTFDFFHKKLPGFSKHFRSRELPGFK